MQKTPKRLHSPKRDWVVDRGIVSSPANAIVMKMLLMLISLLSPMFSNAQKAKTILGAWENTEDDLTTTRIYTEKFFSVSVYNVKEKKFEGTYGGSYILTGNELVEAIEFDTWTPVDVGTVKKDTISFTKDKLIYGKKSFSLMDDGTPGKLAGAWLITGRFSEGELRKTTPGARRTMKILSGTRFQWIAYNVDTKEFFGTGGGTYSSADGRYTENIDFFSRDATRVGASLQFEFSITPEGEWRHSGKSSKGDPIDEIWTQREKIGI